MKFISLTQGKFAQVDDEDYEYLMQWKWYAMKCRGTYYAIRRAKKPEYINGKRPGILMHRFIMKAKEGVDIDHQDHDGLNCQKYNMREATAQQNQANRTNTFIHTSKFRGVHRRSGRTKFYSSIKVNQKLIYLGSFELEKDAANAYNKAAMLHFGDYANLNIV